MLDFDQPFELDDGTPVEIRHYPSNTYFDAKIPKSVYRPEYKGRRDPNWDRPDQWWTFCQNKEGVGVFMGGSATKMFTIRNADNSASFIPEDWS